jgi:hypothetical protein
VSPARFADVVLVRELASVTGSIPPIQLDSEAPRIGSFADPPGDPSPSRHGEGALLALETLGLLSGDEAADWRSRFAIVSEGWHAGRPQAGERVERAASHLTRLLDDLKGASGTPARVAALDRFEAAFALCLYSGLVSADDAAAWGERLERALGKDLEDFDLEQMGVTPDDEEWDGWTPYRPGALLRVVPALPERHAGLCITAVELHENGFCVHWHALRDGPDPDPHDQEEFGPGHAEDDLGTTYAPIMDGGHGWTGHRGVVAITGDSRCATPVPDAATRLTLRKDDAEWVVPLQTASATSLDSP